MKYAYSSKQYNSKTIFNSTKLPPKVENNPTFEGN